MTRDQALRALTLTPAELFGVADRVGSLEAGKIANITVVRGDLFDRGSRVTQVFIDGRLIPVSAPTTESTVASAASGQWTITVTFPEGDRTITLNLRQEGEQLRGSIQGALGSSEISNGSLSGDSLRFSVPVTLRETSEEANFTGTLSGNVMRGNIQIIGHPNGTFIGTRPESANRPSGRPAGQRPPSTETEQQREQRFLSPSHEEPRA
jgi:hypothetical protein